MEDRAGFRVSTLWLRWIAVLAAASPPALLLWFQDALVPYVGALQPQITIRIFASLVLTVLAVAAFLLLERPWLRWDEPTGTWLNRMNGLRYCGTCRAKKLYVPLKNEVTGWRCVACGTFRPDPARKPKDSARPIKLIATAKMRRRDF